MKIISWNVNGIRAVLNKGLLPWLEKEAPDILCLQETKARPEQLPPRLLTPPGYQTWWNYPERKGYSGVATFARSEPQAVAHEFTGAQTPAEGRILITEFPSFTLMNIYFPNGKKNTARLAYKLAFYEDFLRFAQGLRAEGRELVICGDVNTAHREIDLARPKENAKVSGFLPEERDFLDKLLAHGYVDTFRRFHPESGQYTWWDQKTRARERNVGWRIDYFFITEGLTDGLKDAFILPEVTGSDHCPVGIVLEG
ncbi:exodeoxyribonuclease III [Chloroflexota bacterium]